MHLSVESHRTQVQTDVMLHMVLASYPLLLLFWNTPVCLFASYSQLQKNEGQGEGYVARQARARRRLRLGGGSCVSDGSGLCGKRAQVDFACSRG